MGLDLRNSALAAADIIAALGLKPHPEGGHYREIWRDSPKKDAAPPPASISCWRTARFRAGIASMRRKSGCGRPVLRCGLASPVRVADANTGSAPTCWRAKPFRPRFRPATGRRREVLARGRWFPASSRRRLNSWGLRWRRRGGRPERHDSRNAQSAPAHGNALSIRPATKRAPASVRWSRSKRRGAEPSAKSTHAPLGQIKSTSEM